MFKFGRTVIQIYKRNSHKLLLPLNRFSTNQYNNKNME